MEQQPGGLGEEQRPVIQGQAQKRGEHGARRQRAGPASGMGQRGLDDRGPAAAVSQLGGEGRHLLADTAARGQPQPAGHCVRSARQRARSAASGAFMPGTWRA